MPTGKDPTRIFRTPISPRQSVKLGVSATWSKLKYQTASSFSQQKVNSHNNGADSGSFVSNNGHQSHFKFNQIIRIGSNGELFISYGNTIEVWDWIPATLQLRQEDEIEAVGRGGKLSKNAARRLNSTTGETSIRGVSEESDGLYLVASLSDLKNYGEIIDLEPIEINQEINTYKLLITFKNHSSNEYVFLIKNFGQLFEEDMIEKQLILPPSIYGSAPFTIKASERFVGISTNEGSLTIFDVVEGRPLSMTIDIDIINDHCLFDIQGRFLVYVPRKAASDTNKNQPLTTLNVPTHKHSVYSKFVQTLGTTALDGFSKITDVKNLKLLLNDSSSLKENMKSYISSLINGSNQDQSILVLDLVTSRELACFKPPNGISNLSLSPYNSHLLTITQRGDQLYKWDLTRMPIEINLIDIQIRGKTGSVVEQVNWYSSDIFQIITKRSGSIHCFHSEYITKNWVLPNMQINQIGQVKNNRNLIGFNDQKNEIFLIDLKGMTNFKYQLPKISIAKSLLPSYIPSEPVLEVISRTENFKEISPLAQVEIDTCLLGPSLSMDDKVELATYDFSRYKTNQRKRKKKKTNKRKLSVHEDVVDEEDDYEEDSERSEGKRDDDGEDRDDDYDDDDDDGVEFWEIYRTFGNDLPINKIDLGKGDGIAVFHCEKAELTDAMKDVLIYEDGL